MSALQRALEATDWMDEAEEEFPDEFDNDEE